MTEPNDDIPEWTEEDFESAIQASVRRRILGGLIEPGDAEALQRFLRLTEDQLARALSTTVETLRDWNRNGVSHGPARALFMIAARRPRAIRDNLLPPNTGESKKTTLRVGRHRVVCEYEAVELSNGKPGISSDELERMELGAAIAVLSEPTAAVAGDEMKFARKALGLRPAWVAKVLDVTEIDVLRWEASDSLVDGDMRGRMMLLIGDISQARARRDPGNVRILSGAEALHEAWKERQ